MRQAEDRSGHSDREKLSATKVADSPSPRRSFSRRLRREWPFFAAMSAGTLSLAMAWPVATLTRDAASESRLLAGLLVWTVHVLSWWAGLILLRAFLGLQRDRRSLQRLRRRWQVFCSQWDDGQGYLPRNRSGELDRFFSGPSQVIPCGKYGRECWDSILADFASGKSFQLLERRIQLSARQIAIRQKVAHRWFNTVPMVLLGLAVWFYSMGETSKLITTIAALAGLVLVFGQWLHGHVLIFFDQWFAFLRTALYDRVPLIDPEQVRLHDNVHALRQELQTSLAGLIQRSDERLDQGYRLATHFRSLAATNRHRDRTRQHQWDRLLRLTQDVGRNQQEGMAALQLTVERELGAGVLKESVIRLETVTQTFLKRLDGMLFHFHEKVVESGEQLRTTAETLRLYVQQGGVADTALLHKSLNDFRQVVQELTGRFDKTELLIEQLSGLPGAVNAMAKSGKGLLQGANMAQRMIHQFGELKNQFELFGSTIADQLANHKTIQSESNQVLGQMTTELAALRTTMRAVEDDLSAISREIAAVQTIMQRMAFQSGF